MKISELKEGFADWAAGAASRDMRSVAAGSKAVQKQFIKDFTEDFRNALDSAIRSGYVRIGPKGVTLDPNKPTPVATAKDIGVDTPDMPAPKMSAADLGISEAQFRKLDYIFESIIALGEDDGQASISEWGLDWFKKYMQAYGVEKYLPTAEKILKSMENAYQQQGIKGKMQGLLQFNQALNQLSQLAWAIERSGTRQSQLGVGATGPAGGGGGGGSSPPTPEEKILRDAETIARGLVRSSQPETALQMALQNVPPATREFVLRGIERQLKMVNVSANDDSFKAVKNAQMRLV